PLFIGGISDFFGIFTDSSHAFKAVMMSQWAVFFISVHYFRRSLELLSLPSRWVLAGTAVYALNPMFWQFNMCLYTESLAVSTAVFVSWSVLRVLAHPSSFGMIRMSAWLLAAVMLRPSFLFLLPLVICLLVVFAIKYRHSRRRAFITGVTCVAAVSMLTFLYIKANESRNGVSGMSFTGSINGYFTIRESGLVSDRTCPYPAMAEALRRYAPESESWQYSDSATWREIHAIMKAVPRSEIESYVGQCMRRNPEPILRLVWHRVAVYMRHSPMIDLSTYIYKEFAVVPWPSNLTELILALVAGAWFLTLMIRRKHLYPVPIWLTGFILGQYTVVAFGAQDEYSRLLLPCLPAWILLMTYFIYSLKVTLHDTRKSDAQKSVRINTML
ncbi:MAG: hypothetical protein K2H03_08090, partial [Muribaculaceae bacterium]|nr:hypothetical protein [Muribaculaceae bacterium]